VPAPHIHTAAGWLPPSKPGRLRVGLRWAGNPGLLEAKRDVPLTACAPLFDIPGIDWVALIEDPRAAPVARQFGLAEATSYLTDFQDTGALMCNLDLIISVDTSVANLAGALGLPTWLISRPDADWRWGKSGTQSPWYGSVRVFRHPAGEGLNWSAVIGDIALAFRERVKEAGQPQARNA